MTADLVGVTINNYTIDHLIASGGAGTVYRARQTLARFQREVAVKVIHSAYANTPAFIRRFEAEAQIVARLEHPHIVPLYDYWRDHTGAYLVMRWMPGGSLAERLRHGPLSLITALRLLDQLTSALALAHGRGVIHRDVKPGNVLLDEAEHVYLADFGIAKDVGEADTSGIPLFTPGYAAPEQIVAGQTTPQTDVYSLAVLLHEALTGELPAPARFSATAALPSVRGYAHLPAALDLVFQRATAHDPQARYPHVLAFAADVRAALAPTLPNRSANSEDATLLPNTPTRAALEHTPATDPPATNPYKGLHAFHEADAADFFGRESLTARLLERLGEADPVARFLAVVGPSGAGKSSAVRAGLLPALRQGAIPAARNWFIVEVTPGAHPLEEIEAALLRVAVNPPPSLLEQLQADTRGLVRAINRVLPTDPAVELVLVIDQFEEVFTLVEDEVARIHLLDLLHVAVCDARSRLRLVVTLRADFYDRPLRYAAFGELVRRRTDVVLPLTLEELEQAITRPAERVGVRIEAALTAAMLRDCAAQPGALPLLQYALTELYERRVGQTLTLSDYQDLVGLRGILARRADELYEQLSEAEQVVAREVFLRLIALGEGTEDTRRRTRLDELALSIGPPQAADGELTTPTALERVLAVFGRHRLLTFDRDSISRSPTLELAHEALIDAWGRLAQWIDASREHLRVQRRIGLAAAEWMVAERDASFLARGAQLVQFTQFAADGTLALNANERAFLAASQQAADEDARQHEQARRDELAQAQALAHEQRQRADEQTRAGRQLRRRAFFLAGALTLALVALGVASMFGLQVREQLNVVDAQRIASVAQSLPESEQETAALLAIEAASRDLNTITGPQMQSMLARVEWWPRQVDAHQGEVRGASFSPDGQRILSYGVDGAVRLWDAAGQPLLTLDGQGGVEPRFSPDGQHILTAAGSEARLWALDGTELAVLRGHTGELNDLGFSPDGQWLITADDTTARLWNATGQLLTTLQGHTAAVNRAVFSPDGTRIATASDDGTARLWDANGQPIATLEGHAAPVENILFRPDSQRVLTAGRDGTARLWDVNGKVIATLPEHAETFGMAFSRNGQRIVTVTELDYVQLWDADGKKLGYSFGTFLPDNTQNTVAFGPDAQRFLTTSTVGVATLRGFDNAGQGTTSETELAGHRGLVTSAQFSPDGRRILTAGADGTLRLWHPSGTWLGAGAPTGRRLLPLTLSPDSQRMIARNIPVDANADTTRGMIQLLNTDGTLLADLVEAPTDGDDFVAEAGFLANGARIVTYVRDLVVQSDGTLAGKNAGMLQFWNAEGRELARYNGRVGLVSVPSFDSDKQFVAIMTPQGTVHLWNADGQQLASFDAPEEPFHTLRMMDVSAQGQVAVVSNDGVRVWDRTGKLRGTVTGFGAAWSRDGSRLATVQEDNKARIWDVDGALIMTLEGHAGLVSGVAFSPDGARIATVSDQDSTVRIWSATGEQLAHVPIRAQFPDAPNNIVFSPSGRTLVALAPPLLGKYASMWLIDLDGGQIASYTRTVEWANTLSDDPDLAAEIRFTQHGERLDVLDTGGLARSDGTLWSYPVRPEVALREGQCRVTRGLNADEIASFQLSQPLRFNFDQRQCP